MLSIDYTSINSSHSILFLFYISACPCENAVVLLSCITIHGLEIDEPLKHAYITAYFFLSNGVTVEMW